MTQNVIWLNYFGNHRRDRSISVTNHFGDMLSLSYVWRLGLILGFTFYYINKMVTIYKIPRVI